MCLAGVDVCARWTMLQGKLFRTLGTALARGLHWKPLHRLTAPVTRKQSGRMFRKALLSPAPLLSWFKVSCGQLCSTKATSTLSPLVIQVIPFSNSFPNDSCRVFLSLGIILISRHPFHRCFGGIRALTLGLAFMLLVHSRVV